MSNCQHKEIELLNPYEYIRKYRCNECGNVMMCDCDEEFATKYLPHQIREATELESQKRVPVTIGFQKNICDKCRGLPEKAYPKAEIYGHESKIKRYYWREIAFKTIKRFEDWSRKEGYNDWREAMVAHKDVHKEIERKVVQEIKENHQKTPKYIYEEESQKDIISKYNVEIVNLNGIYIKTQDHKVSILEKNNLYSAEEYVQQNLENLGFEVLVFRFNKKVTKLT